MSRRGLFLLVTGHTSGSRTVSGDLRRLFIGSILPGFYLPVTRNVAEPFHQGKVLIAVAMDPNANSLHPKRGKIPSYEAFYERYYACFCRRLARHWANRQIAEDFVTDGFIHLWEHYPGIRTEKAAISFLISGIRMACRKSDLKNFIPIDGAESSGIMQGDPDFGLGRKLEWDQVTEGLDRVSPKHRKVFSLYYRYGYSIRQIAHELQSSPSSIQNKLAWSIYILKKYFLKPKAPV